MEFGWAAAKEALDWTTRATGLVTTEESSGRDMHPKVRAAEAKNQQCAPETGKMLSDHGEDSPQAVFRLLAGWMSS